MSPKGAGGLTIVSISSETRFEVIAVFQVIQTGYSRVFSEDFDMAVLRDSTGLVSATVLADLQACGHGTGQMPNP
jgi:hypothetical protein